MVTYEVGHWLMVGGLGLKGLPVGFLQSLLTLLCAVAAACYTAVGGRLCPRPPSHLCVF